jgi:DNA-binding PadR family transcriptional regulator
MTDSQRRPKASSKEVERVLSAAEAQGFLVEQAKGRTGTHFKVYRALPDGQKEWITNFPSTPGNDARRSILNSLAPLKRAGFQARRR